MEEGAEEAAMDVVSEPMDVLHGRMVEKIDIEPRTFDLRISFEDGYSIQTLGSDLTVEESWHIRENATGVRLRGSPSGIEVISSRPRPR
jgi:hypothetical protein